MSPALSPLILLCWELKFWSQIKPSAMYEMFAGKTAGRKLTNQLCVYISGAKEFLEDFIWITLECVPALQWVVWRRIGEILQRLIPVDPPPHPSESRRKKRVAFFRIMNSGLGELCRALEAAQAGGNYLKVFLCICPVAFMANQVGRRQC